jgi:regulator of protease activity HflC (stomatin/prohibitin superfamily)
MINPVSQSIIEINQQTQTFSYEQMAISKDNVQFRVNIVLLYRFVDSLKVAYRLGDRNAE